MAGIWPIFLFCVAFSVYEPLKIGPDWLQSPIMMFSVSVLIPFITIGFISPYSFVGERMRGTLEPLLATPVSDKAILFGKIGIAVLYGLGVTLANMLLGLVLDQPFLCKWQVAALSPGIMIPTFLLSLFFSILVATLGTQSSFYAKTLLVAQRKLVMLIFIPMMLPAFFLGPLIPGDWKVIIIQITAQLGATHLLLFLIILLLWVDGIFIFIAKTQFHRKLLLLE